MVVSTCRNQKLNTKKGLLAKKCYSTNIIHQTQISSLFCCCCCCFLLFFFNRNIHFYILLDLWIVLFDNTVPPLEFMPENSSVESTSTNLCHLLSCHAGP